jgi:proteasome lid subunit RPN8/RPN11
MRDAIWSLDRSAYRAILDHGRSTYPEECCGFLIAPSTRVMGEQRFLQRAIPAENCAREDRRRRYEIDPQELLRIERTVLPRETLVGIYHSHPDHPPVPSEFDRERAWPWYSYLLLSVSRGVPGELFGFELDPESRQFHPRHVIVEGGSPPTDVGHRPGGEGKP